MEQQLLGAVYSRQLSCEQPADFESRTALGWHSAHLRSQQPILVVGFVGVRNAIPAQSEIQSQPAVHTKVVLNIQRPGVVVPLAGALNRVLVVGLAVTQ